MDDDDLTAEARRFLDDAVRLFYPPGPEREQLLEWVASLPPEELRYPGTLPGFGSDAPLTRH